LPTPKLFLPQSRREKTIIVMSTINQHACVFNDFVVDFICRYNNSLIFLPQSRREKTIIVMSTINQHACVFNDSVVDFVCRYNNSLFFYCRAAEKKQLLLCQLLTNMPVSSMTLWLTLFAATTIL
jgi:hypothetical protein